MTSGVRGRGDVVADAGVGIPCGRCACIGRLGPLRFAKGTVSSEPLITQIFADGL